jgi:hypothetical protein
MHRLLAELLAMVPPDGSPWPRPARQRWVAAMGAVMDVLYEDGPLTPAQSTADAPAGAGASPFVDGPRPEAARELEHISPPRSYDDTSPVLDLRQERTEAATARGRHARPSTS